MKKSILYILCAGASLLMAFPACTNLDEDHFGQHYHPVFTKVKLPFNNGINIALAKDTEIKSVFNGIVKQIVVMPGYGKCVLVQHGNYFSFYCRLGNVSVKAGDKVSTGDVIGKSGQLPGPVDPELIAMAKEQGREFETQDPQSYYPDKLEEFKKEMEETGVNLDHRFRETSEGGLAKLYNRKGK